MLFSISGLLLISMLLVNIVLLFFWLHDALQREMNYDRAVLKCLLSQCGTQPLIKKECSPTALNLADHYSGFNRGSLFFFSTDVNTHTVSAPKAILSSPLLTGVINEAVTQRKQAVLFSGGLFNVFFPDKSTLIQVHPLIQNNKVTGGVGVTRSMEPLFRKIRSVERVVLLYIVINLLLLSVIGFFRMRKEVAHPIERLVHLADQYTETNSILFTSDLSGNEFSKLAASLNSMVARIELDKQKLQHSVKQLETANTQLQQQQQEMIRTEKMASVGRLAAGVAHEIGNPLGIVQGYLGLMSSSGELTEEHEDFVKRAESELLRIGTLIRQLLDFARISKGKSELFSAHDFLQSILNMIAIHPAFKSIELIFTPGATNDSLYANQDRLRQVIINCLFNSADAIAATGDEQGHIEIVTTDIEQLPQQSQFFQIQIIDSGTGITPDNLSKTLDPFFTTKEPGKGTGLGLSVSYAIMKSMQGNIQLINNTSQGATVILDLPTAEEVFSKIENSSKE